MPLEFFVDENLSSLRIIRAIEAAGFAVSFAGDGRCGMDRAVADEVWLRVAGERGWVVLTADQKIKTRIIERTAVVHAKVRMFVIVKKELSGQQLADAIANALKRVVAIAESTPGPFIARITPAGEVVMTNLAELPTAP